VELSPVERISNLVREAGGERADCREPFLLILPLPRDALVGHVLADDEDDDGIRVARVRARELPGHVARLLRTREERERDLVGRRGPQRSLVRSAEVLDFARPRPLALDRTTARAVAERARQLVVSQAEAAGVDLTVDVPDAEIAFTADAERLGQVLLNLLQNAVEAAATEPTTTERGHVVLRARREPRHVRIEVEDDGPGLPPGNAPVFDAFFSTKPNGTGLGLAIVHRIVTDHGGTVDVESRPGHTRFRVTLPLEH
jgi:signal transduction histidine kinase